jgi:hypothetical protein
MVLQLAIMIYDDIKNIIWAKVKKNGQVLNLRSITRTIVIIFQ